MPPPKKQIDVCRALDTLNIHCNYYLFRNYATEILGPFLFIKTEFRIQIPINLSEKDVVLQAGGTRKEGFDRGYTIMKF